jgi:hypothetical protein
MSSITETIETIKSAITGVCGPQNSKIQRAQKFVLDNGEDIPVILEGLNKICGGIFMSKAGLSLNIPQAQAEIVDAALIGVGRTPPSDLALKKKVGATDLTTAAEDLSRAVNELDGEIGDLSDLLTTDKSELVTAINEIKLGGGHDANVYLPIGTLGSFYSCTSLTDTSPTLVATGSSVDSLMTRAMLECAHWAFSKLTVTTNSPNSLEHPDYGDDMAFGGNDASHIHIYGSFSSDGGCFSISNNNKNYYSTAAAADAHLVCLFGLDYTG